MDWRASGALFSPYPISSPAAFLPVREGFLPYFWVASSGDAPFGVCTWTLRFLILYSRDNFNDDEICMTAKEVIEILKESNLWAPLTEKEKQEVINHALKTCKPLTEADIEYIVGEVYLGY